MRMSESSGRAFPPAANIAARQKDMEKILCALSALAEAAGALKHVPLRFPRAEDLLRREGRPQA